jgi:hypothetical protein
VKCNVVNLLQMFLTSYLLMHFSTLHVFSGDEDVFWARLESAFVTFRRAIYQKIGSVEK